MITPAAELKKTLKLLGPVRSENYQFGEHGVSAQDSDAWVVVQTPLSSLGSFNVNGKKLSSIVNRMSGEISIEKTDKSLILKSAKARVELEAQPAKPLVLPEFPKRPVGLPSKDFKQALSVVVPSVSPNKSAEYGNVVLFHTLPSGLEETTPPGYQVVGTDAAILTVYRQPVSLPFEFNCLVNLATVGVVQLMDGDVVQFGETNKHVWFHVPGHTAWASKPVKKYPGFGTVLAEPTRIKIQIHRQSWIEALHTVEPLLDDLGKITGHFKDGVVEWSCGGVGSEASDQGEYEQLDPDPVFDPKEFTIILKAKYLSGMLAKAGEDSVLHFISTERPVKLESGNVTVLTMPMRG